ncbi:MAG: twin-arginine translocation signal domain-containing protein, partial [Myxococcota bacterium]
MNRRDFIKLAGLTGLSVAAPWSFSSRAHAQGLEYDGPLYLILHAGGGWDPTSLCDPKGYISDPEEDGRLNNYARDDIRSPSEPSPIRWAPFGNNDAFFERHWNKLLVINGLDTSTNNHSAGPRHIHSGNLSEGHPAFAALVAATHAREKPLSFITNGGYDITRGIVARTRAGNLNAIERIAFPNRLGDSTYHTETGYERIVEAQKTRVDMLQGRQRLPHLQKSLSTLVLARSSNNELRKLTEFLPDLNGLNTGPGRQAALAIAAFRAGLCVSANLSTGGFDTHGDHDNRQAVALTRLTDGLNEIWEEAER